MLSNFINIRDFFVVVVVWERLRSDNFQYLKRALHSPRKLEGGMTSHTRRQRSICNIGKTRWRAHESTQKKKKRAQEVAQHIFMTHTHTHKKNRLSFHSTLMTGASNLDVNSRLPGFPQKILT